MTLRPIFALATIFIPSIALADISGPAVVIDGNTIEIQPHQIRLFSIDTPDLEQTCREGLHTHNHVYQCGRHASAFLKSLVDGKLVICVEEGRDRYDRFVATCFANGHDVGMALVAAGWAVADKRITARYISAQELAKAATIGMWAGTFVEPEKWRRGKQ